MTYREQVTNELRFTLELRELINKFSDISAEKKGDILCTFYEELTYPTNKWQREEMC